MSISSAPCSTANRASVALTRLWCAPEGKPTTVATRTGGTAVAPAGSGDVPAVGEAASSP